LCCAAGYSSGVEILIGGVFHSVMGWDSVPESRLKTGQESGAEDEIRTRDLLLGKEEFYR
jgi:hypothetical protein